MAYVGRFGTRSDQKKTLSNEHQTRVDYEKMAFRKCSHKKREQTKNAKFQYEK